MVDIKCPHCGNVMARMGTIMDEETGFLIEKFNKQYPPIKYIQFSKAIHDRFLIIDDVVYHMGASLKDMGKSLCVVTKMEETPQNIIDIITK